MRSKSFKKQFSSRSEGHFRVGQTEGHFYFRVGSVQAEVGRAGPGQAGPGRAGLNWARPGRAELGRAGLGWARPSRPGLGWAGPESLSASAIEFH